MSTTAQASARAAVLRSVVSRGVRAYAAVNRRRKATIILDLARRNGLREVLLVGAAGTGNAQDGLVESALQGQLRVVSACNIEPLPMPWPSVVGDGRTLPYRTASVDLVVSNAVVEHVGGEDDQRAFVAEHERVGRFWVITTPNRLFPVEPHTSAVLRHYSRSWRDRQPDFTRMLTKRELRRLLPPGSRIIGHAWSPTFIAVGGR
ncbi:MAG: methyltransferase domain-containing protein [Mycobacteriales bacterium]